MTTPLPARPTIADHEDLESYLQRCAHANHLTPATLTGHTSLTRVSEAPPDHMLEAIASRTRTSVARLRRATLTGAFPGAVLERARTGRRWSGQPATCPSCSVETVGARLNLVVLCPRCGTLLADDQDPQPLPPPAGIAQVQADVVNTLARARQSKLARDRLTRLEALMRAQEPAMWTNWPPLLDGETPTWRARVVRVALFATTPGVVTARPPFVTATLMALTWPMSADAHQTNEWLDTCAINSETADATEDELPDWHTLEEARWGLARLLHEAGLRFEHVPTTVRLPEDPIVLPPYLRSVRTAEALVLATLTQPTRARNRYGLRETAGDQHHSVSNRVLRVGARLLESTVLLRYTAAHARRIHPDGPRDVHRLRGELRNLTTVPTRVTRQLPQTGTLRRDLSRVAAAWVWLDATQGRSAGGPHPHMAPGKLVRFDAELNPEGRLILREWWQQRLQEVSDQHTTHSEQVRGRRTG